LREREGGEKEEDFIEDFIDFGQMTRKVFSQSKRNKLR
jgi:hypothetical protein